MSREEGASMPVMCNSCENKTFPPDTMVRWMLIDPRIYITHEFRSYVLSSSFTRAFADRSCSCHSLTCLNKLQWLNPQDKGVQWISGAKEIIEKRIRKIEADRARGWEMRTTLKR